MIYISLRNKCNIVLVVDEWLTLRQYVHSQTMYQETETAKERIRIHGEYDLIRKKRVAVWFIKILLHNNKHGTGTPRHCATSR